jgi:hypothetical protein
LNATSEAFPLLLKDPAKPQLLPGLVAHWPAVQEAQKAPEALGNYLSEIATEVPVVVYSSEENGGRIGYKDDYTGFNFKRETASIRDVLARLIAKAPKTLYIGSTRVDQWLPGFRAQNDLAFTDLKPVVNFWLGNQNQVAAHFDTPDNLACCVAGHRTFTLFPPDQIENLYIGPVDLTPSGRAISLVDIKQPDLDLFPKFKIAMEHALTFELLPGDALYIPSLWWHHVQSHADVNMLVNYWWRDSPSYLGVSDLALEHAVLALRGLPAHQRQAWKHLFDFYVFGEPEAATKHIPEHIHGILDSSREQSIRLGWHNFSKKLNS